MKPIIKILALFISVIFSYVVSAIDIRGKVDTMDPRYRVNIPLSYAMVQLVHTSSQNQLFTYTDVYGFYYFYGVGPGYYNINITHHGYTRIYPVFIYNQPLVDIQPFLFIPSY